jgi:hypothetical protein
MRIHVEYVTLVPEQSVGPIGMWWFSLLMLKMGVSRMGPRVSHKVCLSIEASQSVCPIQHEVGLGDDKQIVTW